MHPCSRTAVRSILQGAKTRDGVEGCRAADERKIALQWVLSIEVRGNKLGADGNRQHVALISEVREFDAASKEAERNGERHPDRRNPHRSHIQPRKQRQKRRSSPQRRSAQIKARIFYSRKRPGSPIEDERDNR